MLTRWCIKVAQISKTLEIFNYLAQEMKLLGDHVDIFWIFKKFFCGLLQPLSFEWQCEITNIQDTKTRTDMQ